MSVMFYNGYPVRNPESNIAGILQKYATDFKMYS